MRVEFEENATPFFQNGGTGVSPVTRTNNNSLAFEWNRMYMKHKRLQKVLSNIHVDIDNLEIHSGDMKIFRNFLKMFHYLPQHKLIGRRIYHGIYDNTKLVAVLVWSNPLAPILEDRDRWIGSFGNTEWCKKWSNRIISNNVRFCVHNFIENRNNIASKCLKLSRELLVEDWKQKYGDDLLFYETFVDTEKYSGICYKADNWVCVGETKGSNFHGKIYGSGKFHTGLNGRVPVKGAPKVSIKKIFMRTVYNDRTTYKKLKKLGIDSFTFKKKIPLDKLSHDYVKMESGIDGWLGMLKKKYY